MTRDGISMQITSLRCNAPYRDILLCLSSNPLAPEDPNLSDTGRFDAVKASLMEQGFSIVRESTVQLGAAAGFALELQRDGGKARVRLAFVAGTLYQTVAGSAGSHHDDDTIRHFLESFRSERTVP